MLGQLRILDLNSGANAGSNWVTVLDERTSHDLGIVV